MGIEYHHCIIVMDSNKIRMEVARELAINLDMEPSSIVASPMNGWFTMMIAPDGSKHGWERSTIGDEQRARFLAHPDITRLYKVFEIGYGELGYSLKDKYAQYQIVQT